MLEKIDRYQIIRELGRGGMATVYLATDPLQREVAVKVLPRQFLHDPQFRARFRLEAQTIAALEHPAIVPVYDFGDQDQPFIVMRYMAGGSLAERIEGGALPLSAAIRIIDRLADALDVAHQNNIFHRDLKPANILFDQYDNAYLSDFGIVKLGEKTSNLTGNNIIGTAAYMSPEQAQRGRAVDGRTDIYALGVVLFEMLSNDMPFGGDTPVQQLIEHITQPIPNILERNPNLPPAIDSVIRRALAKNPNDRYQNARELAEALVNVLSSPPPSADSRIDVGKTQVDNDPFVTQLGDDMMFGEDDPPDLFWEEPADSQAPSVSDSSTILGPMDWEDDPQLNEPSSGTPGYRPTILGPMDAEDDFQFNEPPSETPSTPGYRPTIVGPMDEEDDPSSYVPQTPTGTSEKPRSFLLFGIGGMLALILLVTAVYFILNRDNSAAGGTTEEPPTAVVANVDDPPTDVPPTDAPPTDVPPTDVPPTEESSSLLAPSFMIEGQFGGGGSRIAFQSQQGGGTWTIWTMGLEGKNRLQLTDDEGNDTRPRWSPDGQWLTFTSDRDGGEDMWMMRPDGSELQKLTTNALADFTGAWSPDGEWLAYHADLEGVASILKMRADGSETVRLTSEEDGHSFWPSWSPDGERLVFWTIRSDEKPEIWTMDNDGANQAALVTGDGSYLDPVWSPTSQQVAYYAYTSGAAEIFTVDADGGTPTKVETNLPADTILGDWSPDGEWIVLHTNWHGSNEIYRVRADGSESKRLTNSGSDDRHAAWQPKGQTTSNNSSDPIIGEITIWHAFPGTEGETIEASFRTFEALYPDVDVTARFIEQEEAKAAFETSAEPPDIFLAPIDWGGSFVEDGLVRDPTTFLTKPVLATLNQAALENAEYAGQLVGLPFTAKGILLFRNKTLQAESASSLEQILRGDVPFNLERGLYYSGATLAAQGGQLMDADGNPTFNDVAGITWLQQLANFNDDQAYGDGDIEAFVRGEVGFILDATWNIQRLVNSVGVDNLAIDAFPTGMSGWVLYDVAYVSASVENEQAVSAFLAHLISAEIQTVLADSGRIPVTNNATITDPFVEQAATVLAASEPFPIAPAMAEYWVPLTTAIESVASGGDVTSALIAAERDIREALGQ